MSRFTELIEPRQHGPVCRIKRVLEWFAENDPETHTELVAALDNPNVQHASIARAIKELTPLNAESSTVGRHRRGDCSCG